MGRAGRSALESWRRTEAALRAAEPAHHALHLCAQIPGPQALECAAQDQLWEAAWESRLQWLEAQTASQWIQGELSGRGEGARLKVDLSLTEFSRSLPVERKSCPVCSRRFQIQWKPTPRPRWQAREGVIEKTDLSWFRSATGKWQYRLRLGLGEGKGESSGESERIDSL
jgi:hypothetical protein